MLSLIYGVIMPPSRHSRVYKNCQSLPVIVYMRVRGWSDFSAKVQLGLYSHVMDLHRALRRLHWVGFTVAPVNHTCTPASSHSPVKSVAVKDAAHRGVLLGSISGTLWFVYWCREGLWLRILASRLHIVIVFCYLDLYSASLWEARRWSAEVWITQFLHRKHTVPAFTS